MPRQGHRELGIAAPAGHAEMRAARRARAPLAAGATGQRHERHLPAHRRVRPLEQLHRVRPVAQEDRAPVPEGAPAQLLVGGGRPRRAHPRLDQAAEESERVRRPRGLGKDRAVLRQKPGAVGPERLEDVDDEPFVLLALPEIAVERGITLPDSNAADLVDELLVRLGRAKAVLGQEIRAVVEEADVEVPGQCPDAPVVRRRGHRAREVRRELVRPQMRRQIGEPPGAGELGDPDAIEHHDVEPRAPALEVDDVELVLIVRGPRQRLAVDADPWM